LTTYFGPAGINMTVDLRVMSGVAWQALISTSAIPAADRPYRGTGYPEVLLEQRGIRNNPVSWNLNFRIAKAFKIGSSQLELRLDVFNLLNAEYYYNVNTNPTYTYADGASSFGKPSSLFPPRNAKIGFTWKF
jgi:outer membrane receptor protein involved in Fe transport